VIAEFTSSARLADLVPSSHQKPPTFTIKVVDDGAEEDVKAGGEKKMKSRYTGVYWNKSAGKWQAQITREGQCHHLGYFVNEAEAAKARDAAARQYRGATTATNFDLGGNANTYYTTVSSRFLGICWDKKKCVWKAQLSYAGKQHYLGYFVNEEAAAKAFDAAARQHHGANPATNFDLEGKDLRSDRDSEVSAKQAADAQAVQEAARVAARAKARALDPRQVAVELRLLNRARPGSILANVGPNNYGWVGSGEIFEPCPGLPTFGNASSIREVNCALIAPKLSDLILQLTNLLPPGPPRSTSTSAGVVSLYSLFNPFDGAAVHAVCANQTGKEEGGRRFCCAKKIHSAAASYPVRSAPCATGHCATPEKSSVAA